MGLIMRLYIDVFGEIRCTGRKEVNNVEGVNAWWKTGVWNLFYKRQSGSLYSVV